jgi:hypothetical protein
MFSLHVLGHLTTWRTYEDFSFSFCETYECNYTCLIIYFHVIISEVFLLFCVLKVEEIKRNAFIIAPLLVTFLFLKCLVLIVYKQLRRFVTVHNSHTFQVSKIFFTSFPKIVILFDNRTLRT